MRLCLNPLIVCSAWDADDLIENLLSHKKTPHSKINVEGEVHLLYEGENITVVVKISGDVATIYEVTLPRKGNIYEKVS